MQARFWCVVVAALLPSDPALGEPVRVSFAAALATAEGHPIVVGGREGAAALGRGAAAAPRLDANPVISVGAGATVAPVGQRGFDGGLALAQSIPLHGAPRLAREALAAEAAWLSVEVDARLLDRRLAIARAWLALHEAEQRLVTQREWLAADERTASMLQRLVAMRERTRADSGAAEVELAQSRARAIAAEAAAVEARAALAAELGGASPSELATDGGLPLIEVPSAEEQKALLERSAELPSVRSRELLARSEWARAAEESASASTRMQLGIEARRDGDGPYAVQATVGMPLPIFDLGLRARVAREADARRLDGAAAEERVRTRSVVALAIHEVQHTAELRALLTNDLLPAAERAVEMRTRQLAAGEGTVLEVLDARRSLMAARSQGIGADHEEARARIRLALMHRAWRAGR